MGGCKNTTSGCRVRAYKHGGFSGPNHGVSENAHKEWPGDATRCMKDCNICVHWSGITGYKVLDCPETTVWAGHYQRNAYSYPMGSNSGGLPYALAVSGNVGFCNMVGMINYGGFRFIKCEPREIMNYRTTYKQRV